MEHYELLQYITRVLTLLDVRYFVTGSTATIFYGEPRFTNDIDIVIELPEDKVDLFCHYFPLSDYYISRDAVIDALHTYSQFNIIHPFSGLKIDLIIPEPTLFNQERFRRARQVHAGDNCDPYFASPEDAILKKLEYYSQGGSDKHLRDIAGMIKVCRSLLDVNYIENWARNMGLLELWLKVNELSN